MARRLKIILLASAIALAVSATPALAAKGGGGSSDVTGTIALAVDEGTARLAEGGPAYGDSVAFDVAVAGRLASNSTVFITTVCWQGNSVVYHVSRWLDSSFTLHQTGSIVWDGAPAECTAALRYQIIKGKNIQYTVLDTTSFQTS